jgi:tetratricopeptide (TPR) repeat protein
MFDGAHETLAGLGRLFAGQASSAEAERAAAHLRVCDDCRLLAAQAMEAQKTTGGLPARGPLRPFVELHEMEHASLVKWLEAQVGWAELRQLSTKARRERVRLARALHTSSFLETLADAAAATDDLDEAEEVSYLALLVAQQLPSPAFPVELKNDLCAECCAEIANARRRLAKWPAARDALTKANAYAERGSLSGFAQGKVLLMAGGLEDDLGNPEEAVSLLRQAEKLFAATGQQVLRSKALVRLAYILADRDPSQGLGVVLQALPIIPQTYPRLLLSAETVRIECLLSLGLPHEALLRFHQLKELNDQFHEPYIQLRRRFCAGRILEHLGRPEWAECLFQEAIAGDLENGLLKDFFLDLVYVLGFHLRRGSVREAIAVCRRAADELTLAGDAEEGSGEAAREQMRVVWRRLADALERGAVEVGAVIVMRNYIKANWRTPATEPPSFRR